MDREDINYFKEETPGNRWSMHGYILTYLTGEALNSGFSTDGSLISASAIPTAGPDVN